MGALLVALIGPRSSIGSPVTFMIRPRVPGPTGIMIGEPVSLTLDPRTRPSVPSPRTLVLGIRTRVVPPAYRPWQYIGQRFHPDVAVSSLAD